MQTMGGRSGAAAGNGRAPVRNGLGYAYELSHVLGRAASSLEVVLDVLSRQPAARLEALPAVAAHETALENLARNLEQAQVTLTGVQRELAPYLSDKGQPPCGDGPSYEDNPPCGGRPAYGGKPPDGGREAEG